MRRPCRRSPLGGPGGHPKSTKKRYEKQVLKKRSLKRPLGCHGEPRGAPGSQNEAKMDAKRLPKEVKKHSFLKIGWKTEKCDETHTIYYTLTTSGIPKNVNFWSFFGSKNDVETERRPKGPKMPPKCLPKASRTRPDPNIVPNRMQNGITRELPKRPQNRILGGPGAQVRRKGAPGGLRAPPEGQNGAKMAPKSIKKGAKLEELNDKRRLPLQPRRNERSSLNAPRQGSALPARRVKPEWSLAQRSALTPFGAKPHD